MRTLITGTPPRQAAPPLEELRSRREAIFEVCARNGGSNVWVFGSVARGGQGEDSDLDLLMDIDAGRSLFDLAGLIGELEDLLGCPVNVVEHKSLRDDRFGQNVRRDKVRL